MKALSIMAALALAGCAEEPDGIPATAYWVEGSPCWDGVKKARANGTPHAIGEAKEKCPKGRVIVYYDIGRI